MRDLASSTAPLLHGSLSLYFDEDSAARTRLRNSSSIDKVFPCTRTLTLSFLLTNKFFPEYFFLQ
jgi:hypothetical protein